MVAIRADPNVVYPRYLFAVLRSTQIQDAIVNMHVGTLIPHFKKGDFDKLHLPIPDRDDQIYIGDLYFDICERIDLLVKTNTTLEAIAQALFKSWFVEFDPARAKAEGREPEGMDAATAALFPSEFEDSELGLIPKGWRVGTIGDIGTLNAESWSTKRQPDRIAYVDLSSVGRNQFADLEEYEFSDAPSRARRVLRDGDSIIGTVRPGNRAFAYIHQPCSNLTGSTGFAVLSPRIKEASGFIYLAATRDESIERLANLADGGAYPAVRPDVVSATSVIIPSDAVLATFGAIANQLLVKIAENNGTARVLANLRDTLLPRLISGKLRLPEAEALVDEIIA